MGKINVLDFEIANLIAAGEVVERPSSVLKELIENSIDSGASKITAEIKRGGVALIRVTDNGCGMTKEDLPVALKRHATSKISSREDLEAISTLGFRGEALAAISSVSVVTIISKTKDAEVGTMLSSEGGKIVDVSEVGTADGTTVVVENLFYNVPARRKFLKKDATEAANVLALVEKVALSRPDIAIQLLIDGEEKFATAGDGDLHGAIYSIFGKDFSSKLIKAEGIANGIRVSGYIGRSDNVKRNRNLENIFINGRYVKSLTAMAAVEKAYTSYIAPEAFPVCVLFIEMNPTMVDVNVHPAKLEVKFAGEQPVFEAIYHTVRSAIENHEYRPDMTLDKRKSERRAIGAFVPIGENTNPPQISISTPDTSHSYNAPSGYGYRGAVSARESTAEPKSFNNKSRFDIPLRAANGAEFTSPTYERERTTPERAISILEKYKNSSSDPTYSAAAATSEPQNAQLENRDAVPTVTDYKLVGEAFDCYVFVEYDGALLVIDKHAAHERIIFEDLKRNSEADGRVASQSLLLPILAALTPEEETAAAEFKGELNLIGFEFELSTGYASITATPDAISASDAEALFIQMTDEIAEGRGNPENTEKSRRERALYQIACKAAIKGGRSYDNSIINWLVGRVLALPDITVCPHGRPIAFRLTKSELDRQFERIK
ncbi:MAG: DNA mismatch repair endonuclease MutL [Clostridia bacterium]|nr:DNA mismatch repair endonuclease MutL [Clostridia bacterium]